MEWIEAVVVVVCALALPPLVHGYPVDMERIISNWLDILRGDVK